jgi:hypothetical protein
MALALKVSTASAISVSSSRPDLGTSTARSPAARPVTAPLRRRRRRTTLRLMKIQPPNRARKPIELMAMRVSLLLAMAALDAATAEVI